MTENSIVSTIETRLYHLFKSGRDLAVVSILIAIAAYIAAFSSMVGADILGVIGVVSGLKARFNALQKGDSANIAVHAIVLNVFACLTAVTNRSATGSVCLIIFLVAIFAISIIGRFLSRAPLWIKKASKLVSSRVWLSLLVVVLAVISVTLSSFIRSEEERHLAMQILAERRAEAVIRANKEAEARRVEENARRAAIRVQELIKNAVENAARFRNEIHSELTLLKKGKFDEAITRNNVLSSELDEYRQLRPIPDGIAVLLPDADDLIKRVKKVIAVRDSIAKFESLKARALLSAESPHDSKGWNQVAEEFRQALSPLAVLDDAENESRRYIPRKMNLKKERQIVESNINKAQKKKSIAREEEEAVETEALAQALYTAFCGEEPNWNGVAFRIQAEVAENAYDPDSITVSDCSRPVFSKSHCWVTTCKVRGRNLFGGIALNIKRFGLSTTMVEQL